MTGRSGMKATAQKTRLPCQVCGRRLVPLRDGTARRHGRYGGCKGSGYRLARWRVGQRLVHHGGSVWEVADDRGGPDGDYLIVCVNGQRSLFHNEWIEKPGQARVTHGEYMHRHGWRPVTPDVYA
jgi:hypothetical protein